MKEDIFRLSRLKVSKNKYLGDLDIDFQDQVDVSNFPYTTLFIGPNKTGKSFILRTIIDAFREIYDFKKESTRKYHLSGNFYLKYELENVIYEVYSLELDANGNFIFDKKITLNFKINNNLVDEFTKLKLPAAILANSIMLTDKFPVILPKMNKKIEFDIYSYLGVRRTPSVAGTKTLARITAKKLIEISNQVKFQLFIENIFSYLGINGRIVISYSPRYPSRIYTGNLTEQDLDKFFENYAKDKRTTSLRGTSNYKIYKNKRGVIDKIISGINTFAKNLKPWDNTSLRAKKIELDLSDSANIKNQFEIIQYLTSLDLVTFPSIQIIDNNSVEYNFEDSSSGEYHIFTSLIGIISSIKENSIILIDEPEISLHPNWQMRYMDILYKMFTDYKSCHFIIATHSHFLVSDLKGKQSKIIGLTRKDDQIEIIDFPESLNTFGWSAEDVLYNVFQVTTSRNYYVALEIGEILKLIAKKDIDFTTLNSKKEELKEIKSGLKSTDPLKSLIDKVQKEFLNE